MCQHAKNQSIPSVHSWDRVTFRIQTTDWSHPFLSMPNQKTTVSSTCSGEIVDLKILESDWLRPFWLISQNKIFPHIRFVQEHRKKIFIIEQIHWKLLTKFFFISKKHYFWSISPIFRAKKVFFKKSSSVIYNIRVYRTMPKSRES